MMYECDRVLHRCLANPSYNMQWYTITYDGRVYCLIPVPVGLERQRFHRVRDILSRLNSSRPFTHSEVDWGPDVGNEILEPWVEPDKKGIL